MYIPLVTGDLDTMGMKFIPDRQEYIALAIGNAILGIVDQKSQAQIDGSLSESAQQTDCLRRYKDSFRLFSCLKTGPHGQTYIRLLVYPNRHLHPHLVLGKRPIFDLLGDKIVHALLQAGTSCRFSRDQVKLIGKQREACATGYRLISDFERECLQQTTS